MKHKTKTVFLVLIMSFIVLMSNQVFASEEYRTVSFHDLDIENVKIPVDLALMTDNGEYYNYNLFIVEEGKTSDEIRKEMWQDDIYLIAGSYENDCRISLIAKRVEKANNIVDFKDYSLEELTNVYSNSLGSFRGNVKDFTVSYVEMNGIPTIKTTSTSIIAGVETYSINYMCSSSEDYYVFFSLDSPGKPADQSMVEHLEYMVKNVQINQPKTKKAKAMDSLLAIVLRILYPIIISFSIKNFKFYYFPFSVKLTEEYRKLAFRTNPMCAILYAAILWVFYALGSPGLHFKKGLLVYLLMCILLIFLLYRIRKNKVAEYEKVYQEAFLVTANYRMLAKNNKDPNNGDSYWEKHEELLKHCKIKKELLLNEKHFCESTNNPVGPRVSEAIGILDQYIRYYDTEYAQECVRVLGTTNPLVICKVVKLSGVIKDYSKSEELADEYFYEETHELYKYVAELLEEERYQSRKRRQYVKLLSMYLRNPYVNL